MIDLIDRKKLIEAVNGSNAYSLYGHRVHEEEYIIELITKAPCETGMTVQRLCDRCAHKPVCYVNITAKVEDLLRLSSCDYFVKVKHE